MVRSIFETVRGRPWSLLLMQIPAASINPLQDLSEHWIQNHPLLGIIIFLPVLFVTSFISSAGTYCIVKDNVSVGPALKTTLSRWRVLFPAGVLVGAVIMLGLVAIILPGIYFAALYLFIPYYIVEAGDEPLMTYLHRSTQLARQNLVKTVAFVVAVLFVMIWMFLMGDWLAGALSPAGTSAFWLGTVRLSSHLLLAITVGAVLDVCICHFFIKLRGKVQQ